MGQQSFENGLKSILESKETLKILFKANKFALCLKHWHDVKLANIFDVQIADSVLNYNTKENKTARNLETILLERIKIPKDYANMARPVLILPLIVKRPIATRIACNTIISTAFLFPLWIYYSKKINPDFEKYNTTYGNRSREKSPITAKFVTRQDIFKELEKITNQKHNS